MSFNIELIFRTPTVSGNEEMESDQQVTDHVRLPYKLATSCCLFDRLHEEYHLFLGIERYDRALRE